MMFNPGFRLKLSDLDWHKQKAMQLNHRSYKSYFISCRGNLATVASPVGMKKLTTFCIQAFIGVYTKVVALRL